MNCNEAKRRWVLIGERGEPERELLLDHLAGCEDCLQWYQRQSEVDMLTVQVLYGSGPDLSVWRRIEQQVLPRPSSITPAYAWRACLAAAAVLLIVVGLLRYLRSENSHAAAEKLIAKHLELAAGDIPMAHLSESDLQVESYLKSRTPFPMRCPPRRDSGFFVKGAGVLSAEKTSTAYLHGQVGDTPVTIFIMPVTRKSDFPFDDDPAADSTTIVCPYTNCTVYLAILHQNVVAIIGESISESILERIARAYGTYPHQHAQFSVRSRLQPLRRTS